MTANILETLAVPISWSLLPGYSRSGATQSLFIVGSCHLCEKTDRTGGSIQADSLCVNQKQHIEAL
ncbi:hypothetical protein NBRC3257_0177 [Gluconobacter thailandicus NBRC 3257]|uniref:Uncharacterized protein n=2 Tax=Gluconobacter thailandicus TaxID=257438 RepID=A0AAP9ENS8_GLUTH|nr:hypothetical protein B932_2343 [Gluconobacter oxydans H24]QEH94838.1 hypothetical protein FXF46_00090 [Gluconobacter thailandicus]GAC88375.1 hypothetical protein NBRC3255_2036 [Gluconobacter thailandicus NBRC 3255]GAD25178.1 hypothetical protein NBRC3257_0177 [Gluconobacter thailandicus NBRC 3257]